MQPVRADAVQQGSDSDPWLPPWKKYLAQRQCRVWPLRRWRWSWSSVEKEQSSGESHRESGFLLLMLLGKGGNMVLMWGAVPSHFLDFDIFFGSSLTIGGGNWRWSRFCYQQLPALPVPRLYYLRTSKSAAENVFPSFLTASTRTLGKCGTTSLSSARLQLHMCEAQHFSSSLASHSWLSATSAFSLPVLLSHGVACGDHSAKLSSDLSK